MEAPPHANTDEQYMRAALVEAVVAREEGDVPIGAVVVRGTKIIGRGHNQRELLRDPTAHAEMIALTAAAAEVGSWRLDECTLYVILEPCTMCAGAIVLARLKRLVFGAIDPKAGACGSLYNIPTDSRLNHSVEITQGVLAAECSALLSDFFAKKRAQGKG
ncbi:MAG: tRNA adenosine(34) deaminase TadA [Phycisphaerales bacterium]|nr:MAG: tRNA adenosine(34) deaminase TadA [Phycisphaerales bacterium]